MKLNTFQTHGLLELNEVESRKIIGGLHWAAAAAVGSAIYNIFNHWDHFKQGLSGNPEQPEN